jgi:hypothetical protein
MKTVYFSPKPALVVDATTVLRILEEARNLQRSKKKCHSDKEYRLLYLITVFLLHIYYFILHYMWGIFHHTCDKDV